jgi:hypothetical protein
MSEASNGFNRPARRRSTRSCASSARSTPSATKRTMAPYLVEWRDRYHGRAALVLKPGSTEEVAAILKLANETRTAIVPQGGNTGLVGGQIPDSRAARSRRCRSPG